MQPNLWNTPQCTKGWELRCSHARSEKCTCDCGGQNHGKSHLVGGEPIKNIKKIMFYLVKKEKVEDIKVGEKCMVLADFSGIKAGEKGTVIENYKHGVMVQWEREDNGRQPQSDGFGADELEYLAFATLKHPTKSK